MPGPRAALAAVVLALATGPALPASAAVPSPPSDPLATEVARWAAFLRANPATDELWKDIKEGTEPALARVQKALADDLRLLALLRLEQVQEGLAAAAYLGERTAEQRKDMAAFEAEWKRMAGALEAHLGSPQPGAFDGVGPAAVRAMGEAALPRVRVYYDASLDYGRSTTPDSGLYYLGAAQAARDYAAFVRTLSPPSLLKPAPVRAIGAELDALEGEILTAYRPPLSIDEHREFITASSAVKEARELEAAGLRHGALLRYLQAVLRLASLRSTTAPPGAALEGRLREMEARLGAGGVDHSLGRLFVEAARSDLAEHAADGQAVAAASVVNEVLPRYFAALDPEPARVARAAPQVAVTLVRWPYS